MGYRLNDVQWLVTISIFVIFVLVKVQNLARSESIFRAKYTELNLFQTKNKATMKEPSVSFSQRADKQAMQELVLEPQKRKPRFPRA